MLLSNTIGLLSVYSHYSVETVDVATSLVKITTVPREGPYMIGQTVQFVCEVDTHSYDVTFVWNALEDIYSRGIETRLGL